MRRLLRWLFITGVLALLLIPSVRTLDLSQLRVTLKGTTYWLVAVAALFSLCGSMGAAALRLGALLATLPSARKLPAGRLYTIYLASAAAQHILPSPSSEVLRTVHLSRQYGYALEDVTAAHIVEKAVDAATLSVGVLLLLVLGQLPAAMHRPVTVLSAVVAVAVTLTIVLARFSSGETDAATNASRRLWARLLLFLQRTLSSLRKLRSPSPWIASAGWSGISEATNAAVAGLVLSAVGHPGSPGTWLVVALTARLSGVLPLTPAQIGVQEGSIALVLGAFGVEPSRAMAAALLYRAVHSLPIIVVGGLELRRIMTQPLSGPSAAQPAPNRKHSAVIDDRDQPRHREPR